MASLALLIFAAMLSSAPPAHAQAVTTAFNLDTNFPGYEIDAIAVNTETNKIYVATQFTSDPSHSGRIFVLDGLTNEVLTSFSDTSADADQPYAIAINPVTNMIYVANTGGGASGGSVTVINGATDTIVKTMNDGNSIAPQALVVNPLTNIIYVANNSSGNVTMYNGATNTSLGTFGVGTGPVALALNTAMTPALLYVVNSGVVGGNTVNSGSIQVVDTTNVNTPTTVTDANATNPIAVAVDVVSGLAYVAENTPASLTVISGSAFMANIKDNGAASTPRSVAVNPLTHRVYLADIGGGSGTVSIFQGTTYLATITMTDGPNVVAVDTSTDIAYAVDDAGQIAVINGATQTATTPYLQTSAGLEVVAVNPVTHRAYIGVDNGGNEVSMSIVDGATNATATIGVDSEPWAVAVNPVTNMIYVANFDDRDVSVINGATNLVVATPSTDAGPDALVVDPVNNLIYVANLNGNSLTVIDGATNIADSLSFQTTPITPDSLAINPVLNTVYGASSGSNLSFSFSSSFGNYSVFDGGFAFGGATPLASATNPATGYNFTLLKTGSGSPFLTVEDQTAPQGFYYRPCGASTPISMDVNPTANSVFIPCSDGTINVLQGLDVFGDGPATVIPPPSANPGGIPPTSGYVGPYSAVAVNPITNMAYVADSGADPAPSIGFSNLYVINGATNTVTATVLVAPNPVSIAVNIASNKIYVLSVGSGSGPSLTIVDGLTNTVLGTIALGSHEQAGARNFEVAANPATGNIYGLTMVASAGGADEANVVTENTPAIACNPSACLTTTILPFDNNTVFTSLPTFSFTAQNHLTFNGVTGVYFQVDTWQGVWNPTKLSGGVYTPLVPLTTPIPPGFHMLYAFAASGDDASTSSFVGLQSSPLVGPIASYGFLVAPPIAGTQQNLLFGTVAVGASGGTQTAYLANNGAATLTYSYTITGPNANDFVPIGGSNQPCDNSGQVLAVSYCGQSIIFEPSTVGNETALLTWTDNSLATGTNVTQVVMLSGTGANVTAPTILTGPANPTSSTSATFTFNDSDPGVTSFTCELDGPPAVSCVSGVTYNGLEVTSHTFTVYGTASGINSPTSTYNWTITESTSSPFNITVIGTGSGEIGHDDLDCVDTAGVASGNCTENVATGNSVSLFADPQDDGSMFGGWGGAAAICGMNQSCMVPVNGPTTVTASFVAAPAHVTLTFTASTSPQTKIATFNCPSNADPCLDPNAHSLALTVPAVNTTFTMSVIANEVSPFQANGDCASGNDVTDDFDCRFVSFFTFGSDGSGGEVVPLCVPYSNGNCIFYSAVVCLPTGPSCVASPGTEPDPSFYQSPVNWLIKWNNAAFTPPVTYQPIPRLYDDPDSQVNNTDPYGTSCITAMKINGAPTSPPIFCQFVYDITSVPFFITTGVDPGIGGTTRQFNDVVVAFPVTLNPQFLDSSDSATSDPLGNIGFTDAVSNPASNSVSITNVTLSDPLPPGPGSPVTWMISPAYSGPGTCGITGAIGSQVLSCSFGDFAPGAGASVHVLAANPGVGQYLNAATVTSNNGGQKNQTLLSIATVTVQLASSTFSSLISPPSTTFGSPVTLSGVISADDPVYPPTTESVSISIAGVTQKAPIGPNGVFQAKFTNIPASSAPYVITYQYAGDANFAPATNTSTTLTVGKANSSTTITSNTPNPSTTTQAVTVGFKVTGVSGATTPTGSVSISAKLGASTVTCSGALTSGAGSCQVTLTTNGTWTLTASYGGDSNYTSSVSGGTSQAVGSTLKYSPSTLNFGTVYVGTTEIQTLQITNTGSSMVTFTSFSIGSISGDDSSGFLGIAFCPRTLNAGKSCTIIMSFTADSNVTKTHAANLVVADTAAGSPQIVPMTATVINPIANLNPSSLNFGSQKTGTTSASKTITLTNTGSTTLTLSTVSISGNFALASGTTCAHGTTLAPGVPCTIKVTFTPTSKGSKSGTVTVTDNALHGTSTASLSGTGN